MDGTEDYLRSTEVAEMIDIWDHCLKLCWMQSESMLDHYFGM